MAKLGVGVIGVGTMGKRHAENLRRLIPEAQLIGIQRRIASAGRESVDHCQRFRGVATLKEVESLLKRREALTS